MRIIRVADRPDMPWKNGGGTTRELLSSPRGAQDFDWRVSVATIAQDGSFSLFPGVERTLVGLIGIGALRISDRLVDLEPGGILRFDGGEPVSAILKTGPLRVLNVMTRAQDWHQEISAPKPIGHAPWRDERPHMFAVLQEMRRLDVQQGDLIRDIQAHDALNGVAAVEICLRRREPASTSSPAQG